MRNYWNISIGISFAMHSLFLGAGFFPVFNKNMVLNEKKEIKEIKITIKEIQKKETSKTKVKNSQMTESKIMPPPPYIENVVRKLMGEDKERPLLGKAQILEKNTNKIVISEKLENSKLKSNPSYMSYYKGIRSKLNSVCQKNYTGKYSGEVSVSFVLSRDGRLESVKGQGDDSELIEVAVRSVKESFPFLPFPPDLEGPACPFEVSILFKNN
jgi:outer membrane biosynthesis protein TonB